MSNLKKTMKKNVKHLLKGMRIDKKGESDGKKSTSNKSETFSENIDRVCEITGWTRGKAREKLKFANECGITSTAYVKDECWIFCDKELEWFAKLRKDQRRQQKFDSKMYEIMLKNRTGWNNVTVKTRLKYVASLGIRKYDYIRMGMYRLSNEELQGRARSAKASAGKRAKNTQQWISKIMAKTGWSRARTILEYTQAKIQTGCSYEDYCLLDMHNYSSKELESFVTFKASRILRLTLNSSYDNLLATMDKLAFNEQCDKFINHAWFSTEGLDFDTFCKKIENLDKIIVKPFNATQGIGITSYDCHVSLQEKEEMYKNIMKAGKSVVEEFIVQHPEMAEFAPKSVNTIRVQCVYTETESKILFAAVRMGRGSVVDNFHAGGMTAIVDADTGEVITPAVDIDENEYTVHPVSGKEILGAQIPNWDQLIELCHQLKGIFDGIGWIGWDFAITESGVDLIEGNAGGSYIAFQLPYAKKLHKGFMDRIQTVYSDIVADYEEKIKLL